MGARSGNNYLSSLRKLRAEVWIGTTRVADPTIHPALVRRARAIASLYDLQMEHPGRMTYRLDDGDRVGLSFSRPRNANEVVARGAMFRGWAECSGGWLGDTPDGGNASLAAMAAAAPFFAADDARFGGHLQDYYRHARHRDWCTAHTVSGPPPVGSAPAGPSAPEDSIELVDRVNEGIIVNGARRVSALGPLAEELLVTPAQGFANELAAARCALAFAINCNARGLALRCVPRGVAGEADAGPPSTDAASESDPFGEMACAATFDHVLVPWERVFLCGEVARANLIAEETGAAVARRHQQAVRAIVAAEFRLGRAANLAARRNALVFPRVQTYLTATIAATERARSWLHDAEAGARPNRWGHWEPLAEPLELVLNLLHDVAGDASV